MARRELLQLLADGEFHSGQELAQLMGVSRSAVREQLNKLDDVGLSLESVKGTGYRLTGGIELLDESLLHSYLDSETSALVSELYVADSIDSTNAEALRRIEAGSMTSGFVCTAEQQTAGRGRRGRHWVSPYGKNIYLSLTWAFDAGAGALEGLSLAVAVAASAALKSTGLKNLGLKWPNDLLLDGAKLGGILIETVGDIQAHCEVVVGIGINVSMPQRVAESIDQPWADLEQVLPGISRNQLLASLINRLLLLLSEYEDKGFAPWRDSWMALDAYANTPVAVISGSRTLAGTARGIDQSGALRLETEFGIQVIQGGEVSLRAAS